MRILFFGNNWVGWQVLRWLREQKEEVVGLVIHAVHKRKCGTELVDSSGLDPNHVLDVAGLREPQVLESIKMLRPDIGISAFFGHILSPDLLALMPAGCINIHPSLLPYNRGAYPNVWSIVKGTPAGVTLHYMDAGVDTGDIIVQRQVPVEPIDTGESLYRKLEQACVDLFKEIWPSICAGSAHRVPQQPQVGTYHRARDIECIDEIDLEHSYRARELIDLIRARTFPPYAGAYFRHGGRKVYVRLSLAYEEQLKGTDDGSND